MTAVYKRELRSYFTSPLGYLLLAIMLFFSGLYYTALVSRGYADMTYVFSTLLTIYFFITPIVTMRLFSEEKNKKTDQLLLTAPVKITGIVFGKYLAAMTFFAIYIAIMAVYNLAFLFLGGVPDFLIFLGNVVGLLLLTGALVAIGIFISALTESQVVAAIGSFAVSFFLLLIGDLAAYVNLDFVTSFCNWISFSERYYSFTDGVFNVSNFVFFASIIAIFMFLTVRVIDRKRWA